MFDGHYGDVQSKSVMSIACEMLYGFCLEGFKRIKGIPDNIYDDQDQIFYSIIPSHLLEKMEALSRHEIKTRNEIFHFERTFRKGESIEITRMIWFSSIQRLCLSTYFSPINAISEIDKTREPNINNRSYQELQKLIDEMAKYLSKDENFLIMYEAEINPIVCMSRIASDIYIFMKAAIPFTQAMRTNDRLKSDP